jgi:hypothetical protein
VDSDGRGGSPAPPPAGSFVRPARFPERYHIAVGLRLAPLRPTFHELPALFEHVGAAVGALDLVADLMSHGLLDHGMRERRDPLGPRSERRTEAVGCDWAKQAPNPAWLLRNMEILQACRLGVYLPPPRRSRLRRRSWCSLWALPSHGRWQDSNAVVHRAPSSAANVRVECQCWGRAGPLRGSAKMLGRLIEWLRRRKPPLDERKRIIRKSSERGDGEPDIDPLDELVRLVGDAQADERTAHPFAPIERNFRERFAGRGDEVAI